jgi:hypothetical protein
LICFDCSQSAASAVCYSLLLLQDGSTSKWPLLRAPVSTPILGFRLSLLMRIVRPPSGSFLFTIYFRPPAFAALPSFGAGPHYFTGFAMAPPCERITFERPNCSNDLRRPFSRPLGMGVELKNTRQGRRTAPEAKSRAAWQWKISHQALITPRVLLGQSRSEARRSHVEPWPRVSGAG